jgi:hypothetical protein
MESADRSVFRFGDEFQRIRPNRFCRWTKGAMGQNPTAIRLASKVTATPFRPNRLCQRDNAGSSRCSCCSADIDRADQSFVAAGADRTGSKTDSSESYSANQNVFSTAKLCLIYPSCIADADRCFVYTPWNSRFRQKCCAVTFEPRPSGCPPALFPTK